MIKLEITIAEDNKTVSCKFVSAGKDVTVREMQFYEVLIEVLQRAEAEVAKKLGGRTTSIFRDLPK